MGIAEFALGIIGNLIATAIQAGVVYPADKFFEKRRILRRVEDATAEAVEPLLPFLENENIPEDKQRRLIQTCVEELTPFVHDPTPLFQGSLNGQKIFESLYAEKDFPQAITEDGLREVYTLLFPRIATLLCQIPAAVKDWENEAWSENYKRLDEIVGNLKSVFQRVDEMVSKSAHISDETLSLLRRSLTQKVGFELDLTGLRADKPISGKFDDFFVLPEITLTSEARNSERPAKITISRENFFYFTKRNKLSVIIGAPGAGKSTWAKWYQRELLNNEWNGISIRKELRSLSRETLPSIQELIREAAGKPLSEEIIAERVTYWLEAGKIVFILDGFDEIPPGERDRVYDWIKDLLIASRGTPLIVTSRPLTTTHISRLTDGKAPWYIEPFDKPRIIDYIDRWYKNTPLVLDTNRTVNAASLAQSWLEDSTIFHLTGNPLLLSTLLMVHHLDGSLPSGRSELYKRYVEGMLGLWDDRRQVTATSVELTLQQKRQILRALALHLFLIQEEQIEEPEVLNWLTVLLYKMAIKIKPEDVLNTLRERTGLIIGPGIYSFSHKSIIEYFVADTAFQGDQSDLSGKRIDRFLLFENRNDDRWNTVIFLWAGLATVADLESFIDETIEANNLSLALGLLNDQFDKFPTEILKKLLLQAFNKDLDIVIDGTFWVVSGTYELGYPSFILRGLTLSLDLRVLINKMVNSRIISWHDVSTIERPIRDFIWMVLATETLSPETWRESMTELYPIQADKLGWLLWATERRIIDFVSGQSEIDISEIVNIIYDGYPWFRQHLPIAIMSAFVNASDKDSRVRNPAIESKLSEVIPILTKFDKVDLDFLKETRKWHFGWLSSRDGADLIETFENEIERLVSNGTVEKDYEYNKLQGFIKSLKES